MKEMYVQNSTNEKMYMQRIELPFSLCSPKIHDSLWKKISLLQYIVSLVQSVPAH